MTLIKYDHWNQLARMQNELSRLFDIRQPGQNDDNVATSGKITAGDHGTASLDQVVNVCYGTGAPPAANTTTEGALFIKYTA